MPGRPHMVGDDMATGALNGSNEELPAAGAVKSAF
jgi:hypothetical protein